MPRSRNGRERRPEIAPVVDDRGQRPPPALNVSPVPPEVAAVQNVSRKGLGRLVVSLVRWPAAAVHDVAPRRFQCGAHVCITLRVRSVGAAPINLEICSGGEGEGVTRRARALHLTRFLTYSQRPTPRTSWRRVPRTQGSRDNRHTSPWTPQCTEERVGREWVRSQGGTLTLTAWASSGTAPWQTTALQRARSRPAPSCLMQSAHGRRAARA